MGHNSSSCSDSLIVNATSYDEIHNANDISPFIEINDSFINQNTQFTIDNVEKQYLPTSYHGIWSKKIIQKHPDPRMMMANCYSSSNEILYVCFGETLANTPLSDIWSFNMKTNQWKLLSSGKITARSRSTAIYVNDTIYCFGGLNDKTYNNDLLKIDPLNGNIEIMQTDEINKPCPRANSVLGYFNNKIYVWGGNDGYPVENDIHILDLETMKWKSISTSIQSRFNASSFIVEKYIFIFGSDKKNGMLRINMENETISLLRTTGPHPTNSINAPAIVRAGGFLFVFGGTSNTLYTQVYGFNMLKNRWYMFHIRADGITTNMEDGELRENGCFAVPRESGMAVGLQVSTRTIIYTLGSGMKHDSPIYRIQIGEALSVMNQSEDLLQMLK